jgi:PAS domain S-box-containing protein
MSVDADWQITYMNPVAERLTGSSRTTALGKSYWELFPSMLEQSPNVNCVPQWAIVFRPR